VSTIDDYSRQYGWRLWPRILDALPKLHGQLVLDLGCGIGDLAADLSARGAHVVGVDINQEFVDFANRRHIDNAQFRVADLRAFSDHSLQADGIWSSFTAAYFPSLNETLASWIKHLRPGGWMALTEVDNLFGHKPITDRTRDLLNGYVADSLHQSRYDFQMGSKLPAFLEKTGMQLLHSFTVPDTELTFSGKASPEVLQAWRARFHRMYLLRDFCGPEFASVRDDFLNCLVSEEHECTATVQCVVARKTKC
jgi:SAM-dependent methyltransferase